jgi:hypothetical protein
MNRWLNKYLSKKSPVGTDREGVVSVLSVPTEGILEENKGKNLGLSVLSVTTESILEENKNVSEEQSTLQSKGEDCIREWKQAFQTLLTMAKPICFQEDRWERIKNWAYILFDEKHPYLNDLVKYDWPLVDIFGCRSINPQEGHLQMGFLMIVTSPYDERSKGFVIQKVLEDYIILSHPNKSYRFYLKDTIDAFNQNKITLMEL